MGKVTAPTIIQTPAHPNNFAYGRVGGRNGQFTFHHVVGSADSAASVFKNPNRQASSTYIVTDKPGIIYQPVHIDNASYADGNWESNQRAITCEHHGDWRNGYWNETVVQNSAQLVAWLRDNGYITHYKRHRDVSRIATSCSADFPCEEVWNRASRIIEEAYKAAPKPQELPNIKWTKLDTPRVYVTNKNCNLWDFNQVGWLGFANGVKAFPQGSRIEIYGEAYNERLNATYLVTKFSFEKRITNGFNKADLDVYVEPKPVEPEWIKNRADLKTPVKMMVHVPQAAVYSLVDGAVIKHLGQGTWVDFEQETTFRGKKYLISSYAKKQGMPNGILAEEVSVPAEKGNEKPEWLTAWEDISDIPMYARCDTDVVDLDDGKTVAVKKRKEQVQVIGTTNWHSHKYAIIDKEKGHGIRLDDLDKKPVEDKEITLEKNQPRIEAIENRLSIIEKFIEYLKTFLSAIFKNFKK